MRLRRRMERDIERDIQEHIEFDTLENIERGMSPADARSAALRKFGNPLRAAEETRAVWRWMWAERLVQDLRYALRGLRRNPLFTAVAVLTLALGIGMNTAVFSVFSAVLLKPLAYPDASRIVWVANLHPRLNFEASSAPDFADWRDQARSSFEAMAGYGTIDSTVQDGDRSAKHSFVYTTPEFWTISGARPALGRLFSAADSTGLVLTWSMFQRRFGGDPGVIGRQVLVDGRGEPVIGVLPEGFRFLPPAGLAGGMSGEAEAFTPNVITPQNRSRGRGMLIMFVVAKLRPGVSVESARAELSTVQDRIAQSNPAMRDFYSQVRLRIVPLREKLVGESRRALVVLLAAVAFVLLIACANLGNLLLARASSRQREISVRAAIGAGRGRLLRQFVVEGVALAMLGGAAGVAVAAGLDAAIHRLHPASIPRLYDVALDWRVLAFTLAISVLAGVAFGLAPALSISTGSLYAGLQSGGRAGAGRGKLRVHRLLVAGELALATVLLLGAGLMLKSLARMYAHPAAFEPQNIALFKEWLSGPAYREKAPNLAYARRVLETTAGLPGVEAVALGTGVGSGVVRVDGPPRFPDGQAPQMTMRAISAGYRRVVGIRLMSGRWITDDEPSQVLVVNETFARRVFGNENPLGQRIRIYDESIPIVGVVSDLKISRLDAGPGLEALIPYPFTGVPRRLDILVKCAADPAAVIPTVREAITRLDPSQPPFGIGTLEAALSETVAPQRFQFLLLGVFAGGALLLAMVGVYGVMRYSIEQRRRELGVRMALGARGGEIVGMIVGQGMFAALGGIAAGALGGLALTRFLATLLFEVKPTDPAVFSAVAGAVAATALAASWFPARKAARLDPLDAIRYE